MGLRSDEPDARRQAELVDPLDEATVLAVTVGTARTSDDDESGAEVVEVVQRLDDQPAALQGLDPTNEQQGGLAVESHRAPRFGTVAGGED